MKTTPVILAILFCAACAFGQTADSTKLIKIKPDTRSEAEKAEEREHSEKSAKQREGMRRSQEEDIAAMKAEYNEDLAREMKRQEKRRQKEKEKEEKEKARRHKKYMKQAEKEKSGRAVAKPLGQNQ